MNKFFQACLGVSAILLATAFLIYSAQPSSADPRPENFIQQGTGKIGKYQMNQSAMVSPDGKYVYHYILVWDTETGKSKLYYFDRTDKQTYEWEPFGKDLPAVPLN